MNPIAEDILMHYGVGKFDKIINKIRAEEG